MPTEVGSVTSSGASENRPSILPSTYNNTNKHGRGSIRYPYVTQVVEQWTSNMIIANSFSDVLTSP